MLSLKDSENFQREYSLYKSAIEKIEITSARERGFSLLSKLHTYCNLIDEGHSSANNGYIDPRALRNNIEQSVAIRQELNLLIKDSREC
jgi:hypothetical protein